jgi:hypothetical protein
VQVSAEAAAKIDEANERVRLAILGEDEEVDA